MGSSGSGFTARRRAHGKGGLRGGGYVGYWEGRGVEILEVSAALGTTDPHGEA